KAHLKLKIDFKPALDYPALDKRIQRDFEEQKNKQFKNSLDKLLPKKLIPVIIELSKIPKNKKINEITKDERKTIIKLLKEFELSVSGLVGFDKAVITSGGVDLKEVDPKTMKSKIIDNLYFAGEILDIDGPTGGYNLQVAWSTGYLAGENSLLL
ncbi:NAD(P)/FAD-dependent oxidoreductase, partial [Patescibacteria group bacterium]|nr:NAD(P)/FAD-dependent oxidoreductase [Patescibacteria group bacterium]